MSKPLEITLGQYLKDPSECPYCGSDEISGAEFDAIGNAAYREVRCTICEHEWVEEFKLVNIILNQNEPSSIN